MLQEKQQMKRSVMDRRSFRDRRILNLGSVSPDIEQRSMKDRRQGWEDRVGWQRLTRWSSFPSTLTLEGSHDKIATHIK
ncbi:MAG: hypothetical protein QNK40_13640 [Desulfobacterales bacterium]|nr:hypothetical protein [Desulfobacterales bacterium]